MDEAHRGWAWVLDGSSSVLIVSHLFQARFVRLLDSFLQFAQSLNEAVHGSLRSGVAVCHLFVIEPLSHGSRRFDRTKQPSCKTLGSHTICRNNDSQANTIKA